jgi:sugar lactone lactonase YvrE
MHTDILEVYFHDSVAMLVFAYDFDLEAGTLSNKRLLIDRRDSSGEPDGMVVEYAAHRLVVFGTNREILALMATSGLRCLLLTG